MTPDELKDYFRGDLRRVLERDGVPQHEQDEAIERSLPHWMACALSNVLWNVRLADEMLTCSRTRTQLWNF